MIFVEMSFSLKALIATSSPKILLLFTIMNDSAAINRMPYESNSWERFSKSKRV